MAIDFEKLKRIENEDSVIERRFACEGFKCLVIFVRHSHRAGYIAIPKGHPAFMMHYDDVPIDVHRGLTFADFKLSDIPVNKNIYWFGFDCAHLGDNTTWEMEKNGHLWTTAEVAIECEKMAKQFSNMTLEKIIRHKLEYMPDWFKKNIKVNIKTSKAGR